MGSTMGCGVLMVDDDDGVRALVADVLSRAGLDVTAVASAEEALPAVDAEPPRVAILDVRLPGASGYALCRDLRDRFGDRIGILFVSGERTEAFDRVAGLLIGADDYLVKPFDPDELVARVQSLARRTRQEASAGPALRRLTRRELEVLRLLAEGLRQGQIADRLVISPRTVATHIEHILEKLGAHSRAEAVAVAYREDVLGSAPAG